jgi:hypothetical protein
VSPEQSTTIARINVFHAKRRSQGIATYAALNSKFAIIGDKFVPPMVRLRQAGLPKPHGH